MQATFVVIEPKLTPSQFTVELPATVGRGREADLKFSNGLLSRRHCELVEGEGGIVVRDLGSRNGTFIGGNRVERAPLAPGELLTVGGITMRAVYGEEDDVALAPAAMGQSGASMLDETTSLDDTQTVRTDTAEELDEWPEEESSLEFEPAEPATEELKTEELQWLDEPETTESPDAAPPKKAAEADDDFDQFLEGLR
jgi:pSer/pThr/pTyr-binding forkhead associated (FHA) protein